MSFVDEMADAILRADGHEWLWVDAVMDSGPPQCWCVSCGRQRDTASLLRPGASPPERCPAT